MICARAEPIARRPIAVFCDGWAYHRAIVQADAQKRSALVASRRYWVWSVTYDDVKAALGRRSVDRSRVAAYHRSIGTRLKLRP